MKNAALLLGIWVGIYLFAFSVAHLQSVDATHVALPIEAGAIYERNGLAFPLPVGWSVVTLGDAARLTAPIAGIEAWAVSVAGTTVEDALSEAWETVDPCSSCARPDVLRSAPLAVGREGAAIEFATDAEGRTGRAVVLLQGERARVLLTRQARGVSLPARVESDLQRIEVEFRIVESEPLPAAVPNAA
jgi:hypothetical protein